LDVAASLDGASGNVAEVCAGGIGARSLGKSLQVLFLSGKWENLNISKTKKLDLNLFYPNVPIGLCTPNTLAIIYPNNPVFICAKLEHSFWNILLLLISQLSHPLNNVEYQTFEDY
jgi:hypothetical protein